MTFDAIHQAVTFENSGFQLLPRICLFFAFYYLCNTKVSLTDYRALSTSLLLITAVCSLDAMQHQPSYPSEGSEIEWYLSTVGFKKSCGSFNKAIMPQCLAQVPNWDSTAIIVPIVLCGNATVLLFV